MAKPLSFSDGIKKIYRHVTRPSLRLPFLPTDLDPAGQVWVRAAEIALQHEITPFPQLLLDHLATAGSLSRVTAIKLYRDATGKNLRECRKYVDDLRAQAKAEKHETT